MPWFHHRTRTATTVASLVWISSTLVWWHRRLPNPGGVRPGPALVAGAVVSSAVIGARFAVEADKVDAYNADRADPGSVAA